MFPEAETLGQGYSGVSRTYILKNLQGPPNFNSFYISNEIFFLIPKVQEIILADPGTLSGELNGKLGLEASKNPIFKKLTSKISPNSNLATFMKKSKISSCRKNWLVTGMQVKFSGNFLIDSNKWWKFQSNWRTVIESFRWPWLEWPINNCYCSYWKITWTKLTQFLIHLGCFFSNQRPEKIFEEEMPLFC